MLQNFAPPRLAVQFYLPRLLKFGDALLHANAHYVAQKQCYERFIEARPVLATPADVPRPAVCDAYVERRFAMSDTRLAVRACVRAQHVCVLA